MESDAEAESGRHEEGHTDLAGAGLSDKLRPELGGSRVGARQAVKPGLARDITRWAAMTRVELSVTQRECAREDHEFRNRLPNRRHGKLHGPIAPPCQVSGHSWWSLDIGVGFRMR